MAISAISGMGGIGKSELALQYAYEHLEPTYSGGICWLKAREDVGLQIVEFARIYAGLTPPSDWKIDDKVRWCWQQWRDELTLIVCDDVQNYGDIQPFLPPPKSQFRTLLSSRLKFSPPVENFEIKVLSKTAAVQLLGCFPDVRRRVDADLATAEAICEWLGYLPLGLELVGRYLAKKPDLTLAQVWERLQSQGLQAKALQVAQIGMTETLGVIAAFELSWQELTPSGQELAARLSLFALAEIPWGLVEDCCSEMQSEELEDLRDRELLAASLLTRTRQGMYELHQLLRKFFSLKLAEMHQRKEFTTKFAQVLTAVARNIPQVVTIEQQANLIEFIPHLAAATEFSEYLEGTDKIWCCASLGRFYQSQSQFYSVEFWYRKSLNITEEQLGENHPDTATSLNNLAALYNTMGRYIEAESMYVQSLVISEEQLGENHSETATSLNNLAALYVKMGRYIKAKSLYARSLVINKEQLGVTHPNTAISLNNLAGLYESMGKYAEAESLYILSLAIREKLGANHPYTANCLNNLADLYKLTCRYSEAEPLYLRSLAIKEKELGANHPDTAFCLNNLAGLYESTGRYAEAEPLYVRALAILEQSLGTNHPNTQTCRKNLQILRQSSTPATSMTWVEWLAAIPILPFFLAYRGLRWVGKIVAILAIMPIVPFWWTYRQLRMLWLKRRQKIRRHRRR